MKCDICGRDGAKVRRVSRTYGKGKRLLVIENVPIVSCPNCGKSYLTAETLHEIERLKLHQNSLASERPVRTLVFAWDTHNAVINKRASGMGLISGRKAFQRPMKDGAAILNAIPRRGPLDKTCICRGTLQ